MKRIAGLTFLATLVLASGCVRIEQHVRVRPDAKADTGFALRLPLPMGAMVGQMLDQQLAGVKADLPEGLSFDKREENGETVLELRVPAELVPPPMASLYKVTTRDRLLTRTYSLSIDPKALNPREFLRFGQAPQTPRAPSPAVIPAQLDLGSIPGLESPEGLQGLLQGLGGLLGGQGGGGLDPQALLAQVEMATYVHMPGRLLSTNGERVDTCTAKWLMEPKQPGEVVTFAGGAMTAESEAGNSPTIDELARRLTEGHGLSVSADDLVGLAARRLIPNPEVSGDEKPLLDVDLYSELVSLAVGLDQLVGPERTPVVMDRLGLLVDQPGLAAATKAAKRLPRLREQPAPRELAVDVAVQLLTE
jgi:hypothetical protein